MFLAAEWLAGAEDDEAGLILLHFSDHLSCKLGQMSLAHSLHDRRFNSGMSITEKNGFAQARRNMSSRLKAWLKDRKNKKKYGPGAPLFAERLWIRLDEMECALKFWSTKQSGDVVTDWPVNRITPVREIEVVKACARHWHDNIPWDETGIYQRMMEYINHRGKVDRLESESDVKVRYQELDDLYRTVLQNGELTCRRDLIPGNFREEGGILVHIGPDGSPYFGGKGHHRLAVALAAGIDFIPVQLGVVHLDGLASLPKFRVQP